MVLKKDLHAGCKEGIRIVSELRSRHLQSENSDEPSPEGIFQSNQQEVHIGTAQSYYSSFTTVLFPFSTQESNLHL